MSTYSDLKSAAGGSATTVYAALADLPLSDVATGAQAYVGVTNRLYLWNGTGWYNIALINTAPTITTGGDATYALAADGSATVVTLEANDPEGFDIVWSYAVTTGSLGSTATVAQNNNVFTITPSIVEADAGEFSLTFTASDGVNLSTSASAFSLSFAPPDWTTGTQQAKLQSSDIQDGDFFGKDVSISGDGNTAIVSADAEDTGASAAGAAYIFTRSGSTWTEQAKIQASDAQELDYFGVVTALSLDGNTAIVGAPHEDTGASAAGAAYIFTRSGSTWTEQAKIQSFEKEATDQFGTAVALSNDGNTAIVGAPGEDTYGNNAGACYAFVRSGTTWSSQGRLPQYYPAVGDGFGTATALSGDGNTAIVSTWWKAGQEGTAYKLTRTGSTWAHAQEFQQPGWTANGFSRYGWACDISSDGTTIVVSSPLGGLGGLVYIFTNTDTVHYQATLQSLDMEDNDTFGRDVSISSDGNTVVVGAIGEDDGAIGAVGAAYIFTRDGTTWTQQKKLQHEGVRGSADFFGYSVAISDNSSTVISGAYNVDTTGDNNAGAAYIFAAG